MIADFVDVVDLRGPNVIDMLDIGWNDYEDATQHRSAVEEFLMKQIRFLIKQIRFLMKQIWVLEG